MTDPGHAAPNPELLRSLGRLVRGLSALFWGLPVALLVCFHTARSDSAYSLGGLLPVLATGWLLYGLWQLGGFQRQERVWRSALERAAFLGFVNLGLSPFLHWHSRVPSNEFFLAMAALMVLCSLLFLAGLNFVLRRLGAMLPDETLQSETRHFTVLNVNLLAAMVLYSVLFLALRRLPFSSIPEWLSILMAVLDQVSLFLVVPLVLLPLAMTMAMLWKTKQVILDSIFGAKH